jgi:hypothetical protein
MAYLMVLIAAAYAAAVTDAVIESARTGARTMVAFGTVLFEAGLPQGVWILCGVSASAALALAAAVAHVRGRRLERRMAAELDARYEQASARAAGDVARERLLDGRVAELQTSIDTLTAQRDRVYADVMRAREHLNAAGQVVSVPDAPGAEPGGASAGTVVVPEAPATPEPPRQRSPEPPSAPSQRRAGNGP